MGKNYSSEDKLAFEEVKEVEPPNTKQVKPPGYSIDKNSKIIKDGFMKFEVKELESAKHKIDALLKQFSGYYENEQYDANRFRISYSLRLRIPNNKFDSLIYVLEDGIGELQTKNITAQDVTEEYTDLNIRLDNNLAYLIQYKEILKKAESVKEILEVQEKIRKIEEEIDSKKGRINFLDDKVKYSSLSLELSELVTTEISNKLNFGRRIVNSFNNGAQVFLSFIIGLVSLWPFILLAVLIYLSRKSILNKIKRRKRPTNKN